MPIPPVFAPPGQGAGEFGSVPDWLKKLLAGDNTPPPTNTPSGGGSSGGGGPAPPFMVTADGIHLTKAEYDALFAQLKHIVRFYGIPVGDAAIKHDIQMGLDPTEFTQRAVAYDRARTYAPYLANLNATLRARGLLKPGAKDVGAEFFLGESPAQFQNVWDEVNARTAAGTAGFDVAGIPGVGTPKKEGQQIQDLAIGRGTLLDFTKQLNLAPGSNTEEAYGQILQTAAKLIATGTLSASRYKHYGVDQADVLRVAAGIGSTTANQGVERIINEEQAFEQLRANPVFQQVQGGGKALAGTERLAGPVTA